MSVNKELAVCCAAMNHGEIGRGSSLCTLLCRYSGAVAAFVTVIAAAETPMVPQSAASHNKLDYYGNYI